MLFTMDAKKLIQGKLYDYPSVEFTGKTIRQILEDIVGQCIVLIISQGMEGTVHVCGNAEIEQLCVSKSKKGIMSAWAILSLWQDSPIIDIVWPPIPTLFSAEKASSPTDTGFVVPDYVSNKLAELNARKPQTPIKQVRETKTPEPTLFDPPSISAEDLFQNGYRELSAGHLDDALAYFKQAVTLKPEFERAWSALGSALEEATRDDDALTAYNQAAKLDSRKWETAYAVGRILVRKRRIAEAIERLESAVVLSKKNRDVIALLANAYVQNGETLRAAELMAV